VTVLRLLQAFGAELFLWNMSSSVHGTSGSKGIESTLMALFHQHRFG
jgi:hypothetical protein